MPTVRDLQSTIKIKYAKKLYDVKTEKVLCVMSMLSNKNIRCKNEEDLLMHMRKHKLFTEDFLNWASL